ncbi:MAG: Long-chain-fatty-acid--CoA ligase FadD13 [Frankiales bacterium]|nr:Long-chain-fatty-acid--CoA ligase FadD13 [Frankiales bacterium]
MSSPLQGEWGTLDQALVAAGGQFGDREAYVDGADRLTFAAWVEQAGNVASALADRGVRPGDVVLVLLPSCIDFAVVYAALVRLGATASAINPRLGPREGDAIAVASAASLVVRDRDIPCGEGVSALPFLSRSELRELRHTAGEPPARVADPSELVALVWTSGTTGTPKGACFDHESMRAAVVTAGVMAEPFDRRLVPTPLPHAGYMTKLWEQVAWGITIVITPTPWSASSMLRVLTEERISVCGGVPTQFAKLLELDLEAHDLSALRLALVATAPAAPDLVAAITARMGCPVVVRYAMTECPSISGTEPGDAPEVLFRTVGRPQVGVEVRLVDESEIPVPAGEVGLVRVRSAGSMKGYWQGAGVAPTGLRDGWVLSSDLARFDADGSLVLVGRRSDMYIRGGYNVHPQEVENVLREHPSVAAAAVLGVGAPVIGEIGVAFVVPIGEQPSLEELQAWCAARLADYKKPDRLVVLDALPVTSMLKTDKDALRRLL